LLRLYDRYLTAYTPLFLRFVGLLPGSTLSVWRRYARRPGESRELRVCRSYRSDDGIWFPQGMTTSHLAPDIVSAASAGHPAATDRMLIDGGRFGGANQAVATSLPQARSLRQHSLPQFGGRRVLDEVFREPQTLLLVRGRRSARKGDTPLVRSEEVFWSQAAAPPR